MDNLVKLLDADAEDAARLAGLRAIHALATRQGEILRHRVGCRACVDAVWRQLQPFERVVEPTEEEVAAAEEAGAPKPEATKRIVSPSNQIVFHALAMSCDDGVERLGIHALGRGRARGRRGARKGPHAALRHLEARQRGWEG